MTPTLGAALLYVVHRDGVTTTSSSAGADLGQTLDNRFVATVFEHCRRFTP